MIEIPRKSAAICLAVLLLGACEHTDEFAPVNYRAQARTSPIAAISKTIQLEIVDNRGVGPDKIGTMKDPVGNDTAALRSSEPIRTILGKALTEELAARGYSVGSGQLATVDVSITAMHTIFVPVGWTGAARGIVAFAVTVTGANGTTIFKEQYAAIHSEPDTIARFARNAATAVEGALAKSMKKLFDDPQFTAALMKA